jgi:hypothetical protein
VAIRLSQAVLVHEVGQGRKDPSGIAGGLRRNPLELWGDGWRSQGLSRLSVQQNMRTGVAFPPVGPVGDGSPPSSVRCSAKTAADSSRVASLVARFPIPCWLLRVRRDAPLSAPGGVLRTCHRARRTAAFRCVQTVGVPLDTPEGIFVTTTIHISGLYHAAGLLTTPGSVYPLTRGHAGSFLTCRLGFDQVGLELVEVSPTG